MQKVEGGADFPPKTPLRPARIFLGRFGNFGDKCKRSAGRKNEGAVAWRRKKKKYNFL